MKKRITFIASLLMSLCLILPTVIKVEGLSNNLVNTNREAQHMVLHVSALGNDMNDGKTVNSALQTLAKAIDKANDGTTIVIHGELKVSKKITITKSLTLMAIDDGAKLLKDGSDAELIFNAPTKKLILGNINAAGNKTLAIEKLRLRVNDGDLELYNGVSFIGSDLAAVWLEGEKARANVYGGQVSMDPQTANPEYAFYVSKGAKIGTISDGSFSTRGSVIKVDGENSKINEISGGTFTNNMHEKMRNGTSCVLVNQGASIGKISGGTFKSVWDAALDVRDGSWVDEISGGTFISTPDKDYHKYQVGSGWWRYHYFSAVLTYVTQVANNPAHKTGIGLISGGNFNGVHALFAVGNNKLGDEHNGRAIIEKIKGGNFTSTAIKDANNAGISYSAIFLGQVSKINVIEGGTFKTNDGSALTLEGDFKFQESVAEIDEIKGGTFASAKSAVVVNQGHIKKISDGIFRAKSGYALNVASRRAIVDEIENGNFEGVSGAIYVDTDGTLNKINAGKFKAYDDQKSDFNKFESTIYNKSGQKALLLEPNLNNSEKDRGVGRYATHLRIDQYWVQTKNAQGNITFPQYTGVDGTKKDYIFSGYEYIYPFRTQKTTDPHKNAFVFYRVLYRTKDKSRGSISWKNNDYYDDPKFDKTQYTIYALEKKYENKGDMLDDGYCYLTKQPILKYDANFPQNVQSSGEVPQKPVEVKPFYYSSFENGVKFKNGTPSESLFEVKDNIKNLKADGYKFIGWNTTKDGSGIWLEANNYVAMPAYNVTLYAQWEKITPPPVVKKTVTFMNGDQVYKTVQVEMSKGIDTDSLSDQSMPSDPVKDGYLFKEWNTQKDGTGTKFTGETIVNNDVTVYAIYTKNTVTPPHPNPSENQQKTVTFNDSDGSKMASVKVEVGKGIDTDSLSDQSMPNDPVKDGYLFKEWNTQKDGTGTKFTGETIVNNDVTVYAIYTPVRSTLEPRRNDLVNNKIPNTRDRNYLWTLLGTLCLSLAAIFILKKKQ